MLAVGVKMDFLLTWSMWKLKTYKGSYYSHYFGLILKLQQNSNFQKSKEKEIDSNYKINYIWGSKIPG